MFYLNLHGVPLARLRLTIKGKDPQMSVIRGTFVDRLRLKMAYEAGYRTRLKSNGGYTEAHLISAYQNGVAAAEHGLSLDDGLAMMAMPGKGYETPIGPEAPEHQIGEHPIEGGESTYWDEEGHSQLPEGASSELPTEAPVWLDVEDGELPDGTFGDSETGNVFEEGDAEELMSPDDRFEI